MSVMSVAFRDSKEWSTQSHNFYRDNNDNNWYLSTSSHNWWWLNWNVELISHPLGVTCPKGEIRWSVYEGEEPLTKHSLSDIRFSYPIRAACSSSADVSWSAQLWRAAYGGKWLPPRARRSYRPQSIPYTLWKIYISTLSVERNCKLVWNVMVNSNCFGWLTSALVYTFKRFHS